MRTSALFGAKNIRFFEIYGVSARTGEGDSADILWTKGDGDYFFADVLYGRPLTLLLKHVICYIHL